MSVSINNPVNITIPASSTFNDIPTDVVSLCFKWLNIKDLMTIARTNKRISKTTDRLILDARLQLLELDLSFQDECDRAYDKGEYLNRETCVRAPLERSTFPDYQPPVYREYDGHECERRLPPGYISKSSHYNRPHMEGLVPVDPSQPYSIGVILYDNAHTVDYLSKHIRYKNGGINQSIFRNRDWFRINLLLRLLKRVCSDAASNGEQFNFEWSLRNVMRRTWPHETYELLSDANGNDECIPISHIKWLGEGWFDGYENGKVGSYVEPSNDSECGPKWDVYAAITFELSSFEIAQKYLSAKLEKVRYPREPGIRYPKGKRNPLEDYYYVSLGDIFC